MPQILHSIYATTQVISSNHRSLIRMKVILQNAPANHPWWPIVDAPINIMVSCVMWGRLPWVNFAPAYSSLHRSPQISCLVHHHIIQQSFIQSSSNLRPIVHNMVLTWYSSTFTTWNCDCNSWRHFPLPNPATHVRFCSWYVGIFLYIQRTVTICHSLIIF